MYVPRSVIYYRYSAHMSALWTSVLAQISHRFGVSKEMRNIIEVILVPGVSCLFLVVWQFQCHQILVSGR